MFFVQVHKIGERKDYFGSLFSRKKGQFLYCVSQAGIKGLPYCLSEMYDGCWKE